MPYSYPQPVSQIQLIRRVGHLVPAAFAFAAIAGYINSISLGFFFSPVSHMTGSLSYLGIDLSNGLFVEAGVTLGIIVAYAFGAAVSGYIIGSENLLPGPRFGIALAFETVLLTSATLLLIHHSHYGLLAAAMACGVQNATTSSYCGLMIRTTHVTGTITDIGVMFGHWARYGKINFWKLRLMLILVVGFGFGVFIGAIANRIYGPACLGFAAAFTVVGAIAAMALPPNAFELDS